MKIAIIFIIVIFGGFFFYKNMLVETEGQAEICSKKMLGYYAFERNPAVNDYLKSKYEDNVPLVLIRNEAVRRKKVPPAFSNYEYVFEGNFKSKYGDIFHTIWVKKDELCPVYFSRNINVSSADGAASNKFWVDVKLWSKNTKNEQ